MDIEKSFFESDEGKEIAAGIFENFIESAIRYGEIDVKGLSQEEIASRISAFIAEYLESGEELNVTIDYKNILLNEARRLLFEKQEKLALVVYATWWEHWINGILEAKLYQKNIEEKEFKQIITSLNNRAKTSWLLKLIDLPPLAKEHLDVMTILSEKRNSFVHYKYPTDNGNREDLSLLFKKIESSVLYLDEYENVNILQSTKSYGLSK